MEKKARERIVEQKRLVGKVFLDGIESEPCMLGRRESIQQIVADRASEGDT